MKLLQLLGMIKKKTSGRSLRKIARVQNVKSGGDDHCGVCNVMYGDKTDKKSREEWLQCTGCAQWFHDSFD